MVKLATVTNGENYRLYLVTDDGLVDLDAAAAALGETAAQNIPDVGALMQGGEDVLDAVRRVSSRLDETGIRPVPRETVVLAPPVVAPSKIVCIGLNYALHAEEGKKAVPPQPLLFAKLPSTLIGDGAPVLYPSITQQLDYEGELAVVIGRSASGVEERDALDYVGGFTIFNDISARDLQNSEPQWIRGKSLDTFAPLGPYFVTRDEIDDIASLRIQTLVNGEVRQDASCGDMMNTVPRLIAFITQAITLQPGDMIATGTPHGVGLGFNPPKYLKPGDLVEITISRIGTLRSPIEARGAARPSTAGANAAAGVDA